eukprot:GILK01002921.1.p1 GENE.GILK01002921.1~~GILK01002921.1.p1  ORF type:complete len:476 (-),score=159.29 GILK01002921.1:60-1487(-)
MPPKKKTDKKKKKKQEEVKEEEIIDEFSQMDVATLQDVIEHQKKKYMKAKEERNYVQLEKDMISSFYEITKKEVLEKNAEILMKERKMEEMEENHRVEVKVYVQKVKHLEYEHRNNNRKVKADGEAAISTEKETHTNREDDLKKEKRTLKLELRERELANEDEIKQLKQAHEKNLIKLREEFTRNHENLKGRYEEKLNKLKADLELRRKVEIHEIEERKNQHINDLMKNHEKAFNQIKSYYNEITHDNLNLIKSLKDEMAEMEKKQTANQKLMFDIAQENKRLSEPLHKAEQERKQLQAHLANYKKDKMSLKNARARMLVLDDRLQSLKAEHAMLEQKYKKVQEERDELYSRFETSIHDLRRKAEYKNVVLEKKLNTMVEQFERKQAQLTEVLRAANLDPNVVASVTNKLEEVLDGKNRYIKDLHYQLAHATKAYNDAIRVYQAKLVEFGIPPEELDFEPMETTTSTMPAGLVAA